MHPDPTFFAAEIRVFLYPDKKFEKIQEIY